VKYWDKTQKNIASKSVQIRIIKWSKYIRIRKNTNRKINTTSNDIDNIIMGIHTRQFQNAAKNSVVMGPKTVL